MQRWDAEFRPGGPLHTRLDGSTPFRQPNAWRTIRGRSWAIQDGILDERFTDMQMYKQVGRKAAFRPFPMAFGRAVICHWSWVIRHRLLSGRG